MKLPEHYEKWIEYGMTCEVPQVWTEEDVKHGVRAMYFKLMWDMRPAIEALEMLALGDWSAISGAETPSQLAEEVLAKLKEKGLVEWCEE